MAEWRGAWRPGLSPPGPGEAGRETALSFLLIEIAWFGHWTNQGPQTAGPAFAWRGEAQGNVLGIGPGAPGKAGIYAGVRFSGANLRYGSLIWRPSAPTVPICRAPRPSGFFAFPVVSKGMRKRSRPSFRGGQTARSSFGVCSVPRKWGERAAARHLPGTPPCV